MLASITIRTLDVNFATAVEELERGEKKDIFPDQTAHLERLGGDTTMSETT